jgi:hypothetical protein
MGNSVAHADSWIKQLPTTKATPAPSEVERKATKENAKEATEKTRVAPGRTV